MNSLGAIRLWSPEPKLSTTTRKRHILCQGHRRSGNSKTLDTYVVLESLEGEIEKGGVVNEYLKSPHKAVRCTVKLQKSEKWITQLEVLKKLRGASGGKSNDKDKTTGKNGTSSKMQGILKRTSMTKRVGDV